MHYIMQGIFRTGGCSLSCEFFCHSNISIGLRFVRMVQSIHQIVCEYVLKQQMKGMAMVMMAQMTQFVKKDIILKDLRQTDYVKIEIDVRLCGAAAPVGRIMFYRHPIIYEAISGGQFRETRREVPFCLTTEIFDIGRRGNRRI